MLLNYSPLICANLNFIKGSLIKVYAIILY